MTKLFSIFALVITFGIAGATLSACTNTWHGAGQDVENVGEEMQGER